MKLFFFLVLTVWSAGPPRKSRPGIEEVAWRLRQEQRTNSFDDTKYVFGGFGNERCSSSSRSRSPECREPDFSRMTQKSVANWLLRQGTNRYKTNPALLEELGKLVEKGGQGGSNTPAALASVLSRARKELTVETGEDWSAPQTQQKNRLQNGDSSETDLNRLSKSEIAMMLLRRDNNRAKTNPELVGPLKDLIRQRGGEEMSYNALMSTLGRARTFLSRQTGEDWSAPPATKRP